MMAMAASAQPAASIVPPPPKSARWGAKGGQGSSSGHVLPTNQLDWTVLSCPACRLHARHAQLLRAHPARTGAHAPGSMGCCFCATLQPTPAR